jgi:hypothetical protein
MTVDSVMYPKNKSEIADGVIGAVTGLVTKASNSNSSTKIINNTNNYSTASNSNIHVQVDDNAINNNNNLNSSD